MLNGFIRFKQILLLPLAVIVVFVVPALATSVLAADDVGEPQITVAIVTAPSEPVAIDQQISFTASFTDPGVFVYTAVWEWGDGTQCKTSSDADCTLTEPSGSEPGSVSGSHTYDGPGVYTVQLTVTRKDDNTVFGTASSPPVVVFDPEGGSVTGGGWIDSPPGAYAPDPSLTGQANFGFVSKYKKGASVPTGQTEFQFQVASLNFHSDVYDWLVVAGHKAMFKGTGTINGMGNYGFLVNAIDEKLTPSTDVDLFRIKIWDKDNEDAIVYDNQKGEDDKADPTTAIGGGNIVIHEAK